MKQVIDHSKLLEATIYQLLGKLPWYGALVQSFKQVLTRAIPTAGVAFDSNGESITLYVNPDFLENLTEAERLALLIHEASHVDRLHLIRIPAATTNAKLGNIAADIAINCYIDNLPDGGLYPKTFNLKNFQTFEWYLEHLTDNPNDTKTEAGDAKKMIGPGDNTIDVHDWHNSGLSTAQQAEIVSKVMERAVEKAGLGSDQLPAHVKETLSKLKELKTKNWHKELKKFVGRTVNSYDRERTWSRRNRRYGLLEAGSKVTGQKKLAIAFDTSGSMSQKELQQCLAETIAMVNLGVTGYLIQFDTQVNHVQKLKRHENEFEVFGRGGTNFVDLFNRVDALNCDAVIVFTDGDDCGEMAVKPKTPVLWVITDNRGRVKYNWGFRTLLDK